ncbi:MAG: DUF3311 domain-containing protein [Acetobacteraceae bacterium]|nr:DUF3311 domain-containing protein [Acetobacteraceae bacterium]MBV8521133.1 DUF3311 domain-containing protein [Acetobacteraceae bacterium]MBV8591241.1 DUF3311 domain-containing protein [Acetobacteraceae bacterium]
MQKPETPPKPRRAFPWVRLVLLLPVIAMLWVPSYNRNEPNWGGIPFFYWYQLLWIVLGTVCIAIVYRAER